MPLALFSKRDRAGAEDFEIELEEGPVRVKVTRNRSARRIILRVGAATRSVNLTLPPRSSIRQARNFVTRQKKWLGTQFSNLPDPVAFAEGAVFPLRGQPHKIAHSGLARGVIEIRDSGSELPTICISGDPTHLARRLTDWLKKQARFDLAARVGVHADALDVRPGKITMRDPRSRWGSCAANGALAFSWRLVLAPPDILDYVAAHEVAHLREMNHSAAFWALVCETCPDMAIAKKWLKAHGRDLHGIGVSQ